MILLVREPVLAPVEIPVLVDDVGDVRRGHLGRHEGLAHGTARVARTERHQVRIAAPARDRLGHERFRAWKTAPLPTVRVRLHLKDTGEDLAIRRPEIGQALEVRKEHVAQLARRPRHVPEVIEKQKEPAGQLGQDRDVHVHVEARLVQVLDPYVGRKRTDQVMVALVILLQKSGARWLADLGDQRC